MSATAIQPPTTVLGFDYGVLDDDTRAFVEHETDAIRVIGRQMYGNIAEIGKHLIDVKARLKRGQFSNWLVAEFGMSHQTALNYMSVARALPEIPNGLEIEHRALYRLAAKSTPPEVRAHFLTKAEAGEAVRHAEVREALRPEPSTLPPAEEETTDRVDATDPATEPAAAPSAPPPPQTAIEDTAEEAEKPERMQTRAKTRTPPPPRRSREPATHRAEAPDRAFSEAREILDRMCAWSDDYAPEDGLVNALTTACAKSSPDDRAATAIVARDWANGLRTLADRLATEGATA